MNEYNIPSKYLPLHIFYCILLHLIDYEFTAYITNSLKLESFDPKYFFTDTHFPPLPIHNLLNLSFSHLLINN